MDRHKSRQSERTPRLTSRTRSILKSNSKNTSRGSERARCRDTRRRAAAIHERRRRGRRRIDGRRGGRGETSASRERKIQATPTPSRRGDAARSFTLREERSRAATAAHAAARPRRREAARTAASTEDERDRRKNSAFNNFDFDLRCLRTTSTDRDAPPPWISVPFRSVPFPDSFLSRPSLTPIDAAR